MMRHAGAPVAYMGILALLALASIRLRHELLEKTETYRTFQHPRTPGRASLDGARGNPVADRETLLSLQIPPKNLGCLPRFDQMRLPRCWFSCNFFARRRIM